MSEVRDTDLLSIQEVRNLIRSAKEAFEIFREFPQEKVDEIVKAMAEAGHNNSTRLAEMAVEETGIGVVSDKITKNLYASDQIFESIQNMRTIGIIRRIPERGIIEVGMPVGIICGIIPTTNPTSTVIFKSLIALKAGNPILFSPHPTARKSIFATASVMHEAAVAAGAPRNIIGCVQNPSMDGTREMISHTDISLILATGGSDMVKAAYSSGKPALGVGPGNVPAYIHRSADPAAAVARIVKSKTFDNGTVCSSEQAIVVDRELTDQVKQAILNNGGYFLSKEEQSKLSQILITPQGSISPILVGRAAPLIAQHAGFSVPENTRLLVVQPSGVGPSYPLSREKLSPVIAFYEVDGPDQGCKICMELLELGGIGHSLVIHAQDQAVIEDFALKKPVSRILVNTPSTHGAIGFSTGLAPSLTLGCGTMGGNATSDNITATHLINIKRVASEIKAVDLSTNPVSEDQQQGLSFTEIREMVSQAIQRHTSL